ncbi:hypothetical protein WA026_000486 [Henosepilachna vigintioctopunctata]|uniref:MPN domain-containing protein n=1 Tax=Henosepilachna vigintioctopunctata TaxID=420089 RepID=A0AAW1V534_9CUCU
MSDYIHSNLNLSDLKPEKRLQSLIQSSTTNCVDPDVHLDKYFRLSADLLKAGKLYHEKGHHDLALLYYIRYKDLTKKMRRHPSYTSYSLDKTSAFDYRVKLVTKIVRELTKTVLKEYENAYNLSRDCVNTEYYDGFDEEHRHTLSTIRTFVSGQEESMKETQYSKPQSQHKLSLLPKYIVRDHEKSSDETLYLRSRSRTDTFIGLRRTIFPMSQVRDFELLHRQRRIVRGHRTVRIPSRITTEFSYLSFRDMMKNIETVGYMAGKELNERQLLVTHLILPEQFGYSDFFKVKDSSQLTKYLEQNDLLMIGWIHSHPVDRPYLSSSDMHYHSVFQSVLPEAIAMVYSAKEMRSTIFNLTPDYGLDFILNCKRKGFHTHPTMPHIAMVSQHAVVDLVGDLIVKDFRSNRKVSVEKKGHDGDFFERMIRSKSTDTYRFRKSEVLFVDAQ